MTSHLFHLLTTLPTQNDDAIHSLLIISSSQLIAVWHANRSHLEASQFAPMKFIALVSGGKDSCYNIMKCLEYNHNLVAIANLMPPSSEIEEMNSFMYQSAAHNAIPLMAECLGVPLFRQEIHRQPLVQTLDYREDENDEVEDLFLLLSRIMEHYPDAGGVSCGAIVSNYQRLRVENVCRRLKLIPLTYLWRRDREELLGEIISSSVQAILVKVAGAGLDPLKHLGKDLSAMLPTLRVLNRRFGLDYCGEGGEYETLVLDCPAFKKRLVILETEILLDQEDCNVGNLKVLKLIAVEKDTSTAEHLNNDKSDSITNESNCMGQDTSNLKLMLWQGLSKSTPVKIKRNSGEPVQMIKTKTKKNYAKGNYSTEESSNRSLFRDNNFSSCVRGIDGIGQTPLKLSRSRKSQLNDIVDTVDTVDIDQVAALQMKLIMKELQNELKSKGCSIRDACFVHLYISDISLFKIVNEEYCRCFGRNPPSRSCVAIPLPDGVYVAADALFLEDSYGTIQLGRSSRRQVLHVGGISEWAPMCIGPYAQANVLADSLIYVAGQIPLDPATMTVITPGMGGIISTAGEANFCGSDDRILNDLSMQLCLSLRHAARVLESVNSSLKRTLSCIVYVNMDTLAKNYGADFLNWDMWSELVKLTERLLASNCGEPGPDSRSSTHTGDIQDSDNSDSDNSDDNDDNEKMGGGGGRRSASALPVLFIGVHGIPRDCLVESEIIAFSEAVPSDAFHSRENTFQLSLFKSEQRSEEVATQDHSTSVVDGMHSGRDNLPTTNTFESVKNDLNSDSWPIWHRYEMAAVIMCDENTQQETCSVGTPSVFLEEDDVTCVGLNSDLYDIGYSVSPQTDEVLKYTVPSVSCSVQSTMCDMCVCSGTATVSVDPSSPMSFTKLCSVSGDDLQAAADLLLSSISEHMKVSHINVAHLRTLRIFYIPHFEVEVQGPLTELSEIPTGSFRQAAHIAIIIASKRIFGDVIIPLILIPVEKLFAPVSALLNECNNIGRPILSANYLFIDLIHVKSEMWIRGH